MKLQIKMYQNSNKQNNTVKIKNKQKIMKKKMMKIQSILNLIHKTMMMMIQIRIMILIQTKKMMMIMKMIQKQKMMIKKRKKKNKKNNNKKLRNLRKINHLINFRKIKKIII